MDYTTKQERIERIADSHANIIGGYNSKEEHEARVKMRNSNSKSGFTIIEIIVVIGINAILATITIIGYGGWRKRAYEIQVKSDLKNATVAMEDSRSFNADGYPISMPFSFSLAVNNKAASSNSI